MASLGQIGKAVRQALTAHPTQAPALIAETISSLEREGRIHTQMLPTSIPEAKIQRLLVKQGQQVATGQNLALIKTPGKPPLQLWSQAEGTLESLNVSEGSVLKSGQPFGVVKLSSAGVDSAIEMVMISAAAATPSQILAIVIQATYASPKAAQIIVTAAKQACPARADEISKAAALAILSNSSSSPAPTPPPQTVAPSGPKADTLPHATNQVVALVQPEESLSPAQKEMKHEFNQLQQSGEISDPKQVGNAIKRVLDRHTVTTEIPAPLGAKVVAIHKKKGEIVHAGDILLTLQLPGGREIPILAQQDGIMQAVNISKGGIIGNTRPSSARNNRGETNGFILLTLRSV